MKKADRNYYGLMQSGLQLAAGVGLGFWLGLLADRRLGTGHWLAAAGAAAGLAAGFYLFFREVAAISRDEESRRKGGPGESA
ncbi:MAG: AtpZ/AtpI family protein [Elusimicrobiales bacterium]|nr:AtpZ/AtpI family protein [Elusimicrobiales bacterium]